MQQKMENPEPLSEEILEVSGGRAVSIKISGMEFKDLKLDPDFLRRTRNSW